MLLHSCTPCQTKTGTEVGKDVGLMNCSFHGPSGWQPMLPGRAIHVPRHTAPSAMVASNEVQVSSSPCVPYTPGQKVIGSPSPLSRNTMSPFPPAIRASLHPL